MSASSVLVTIFLRGGADGLNMVVPYADDDYARLRGSLKIAAPGEEDGCLDIDGRFGLHPAFEPLMPAHREGRLAVVHAVGSDDASRSHFEAQDQMEHGVAYQQSAGGGWMGRYLRALGHGGNVSAVAVGTQVPEALRGAPGAAAMTSLKELELHPAGRRSVRERDVMQTLAALYAEDSALGAAGRDTLTLARQVGALDAPSDDESSNYPKSDFGRGLRDVARLIEAQVGLEVATLDLGGWDTHFFQGTTDGAFADRISELATGLAAFERDLARFRDEVTVVVMTEFGRRAYENASLGTDHGHGGAMLVLGSGLRTDRVHGQWPGLRDDQLVGPGDLAVTTDYRSVLSEVIAHCGGVASEKVFPDFRPDELGLFG